MVHRKKSISTKASKKLYYFNKNTQFKSVILKMIPLDIRSRSKKFDSDSQCF